jgi:LuxR family quorum-sensing system transcriptional regulator CciR
MGLGDPINPDQLPLTQLIGTFAFEAARRLQRSDGGAPPPQLTDRQAECVALVARGKTDWEIARILGIGAETVTQHLKDARDRYGVTKRTMLAVRALFDGVISFTDILRA